MKVSDTVDLNLLLGKPRKNERLFALPACMALHHMILLELSEKSCWASYSSLPAIQYPWKRHPDNIVQIEKVAFEEPHSPFMGLFASEGDSSLKVQLVNSQLQVDLGIHLIATLARKWSTINLTAHKWDISTRSKFPLELSATKPIHVYINTQFSLQHN